MAINGTQITGTIRDAFQPFERLEFVDFSNNLLSGTLPASVFDLSTIELLYFESNMLTGFIPENYANAPNLRDLYIFQNQIAGTVPPIEPGQLDVLTEFLLENNDITGVMPSSICALRGREEDNDLARLTADCGGDPPQIECDCCTDCWIVCAVCNWVCVSVLPMSTITTRLSERTTTTTCKKGKAPSGNDKNILFIKDE